MTNADENIIANNLLDQITGSGAATGYGVYIDGATEQNNIIGLNNYKNNDVDFVNNGTGTLIFGDDTAYAATWNGDLGTPTKNVVYDKINAMDILIDANTTQAEVEAIIDAEIVDGQSIDNAIDALILIHKNIAAAHHSRYTDVEVQALSINSLVEDTSPQLGGNLDVNLKNFQFNPALAADGDYSGFIISATVDENTQGFGNLLHLDSDGHYIDAHADAEATLPCNAIALEIGIGTKLVMTLGYIREDDWNFTPGALLWVDMTNSGDITETKPTGTGKFVQCVGFAITADIIFFNPDKEYFELS